MCSQPVRLMARALAVSLGTEPGIPRTHSGSTPNVWPRAGCLVTRHVQLKIKGLGPVIGVPLSCRDLSPTLLPPPPTQASGAGHRQALGPFHAESPAV